MSDSGSRPPSSIGTKRGSSLVVPAIGAPERVREQVQSTLRIGDTILLFSQEGQGFVYSDVSSKAIQSVVVHPVGDDYHWTDPHALPNIHCACYRVLAANKYKAQKRLEELKECIQQAKSLKKPLVDDEQIDEERKRAESIAAAEIADNELHQKRLEGQEVLYGNTVQLQHVFTGRYLSINPSATSLLESTNLRTELTSQNSPSCILRILPRYKVRSVGDEVRTYEQVMFESVMSEGQFLHCSALCFGHISQNLHSQCKELNLSASESAFTVCLHSHPMPEAKVLRAGGTIRLFHREIESYLVAEGSFAEVPGEQITENVHLRKRKSDHGKLKPPSTSAITYWTIEKKKNPLSGEPILWYERCRIKHLLTQQYLAVERRDGQCVLTLKEEKAVTVSELDQDTCTTFRLFPVISGEDEIKYGTYARINHPQTRTWLHAGKGEPYQRMFSDENATGLRGLRWDDAELFKASAKSVMAYDDAFTLMEVEDKLVQKFNLVAGYVPVLKEYMEDRRNERTLTSKKAEMTAKALGELSKFMQDPNARQKDHQKLVRNLRILEQLVAFLKAYKSEAADAGLQRKVCMACYSIIEVFLQGDSRKNELYVSRFVPFFEGQMQLGLNAEDMLIELVRDNPNIVLHFSTEQIDTIVDQIVEMKDKDHRMLDYLGVVCVCEGKAAVPSQDHIVERLLQGHGQDLFFRTEVAVTRGNKVVHLDKTGRHISLGHLPSEGINPEEEKCTSNYRWLESQLDLFGKLAKGNNAKAIDAVTKFVTFKGALVAANDADVHPTIRSKYVELIRVLFVEVGNNRAFLEILPNSFVYSDLKENPFEGTDTQEAVALTGEANQYFGELKKWFLNVTGKPVVYNDDHIEENHLLAQILGVLGLLVKYGYYDDPEDIRPLLKNLLARLKEPGPVDPTGKSTVTAEVKTTLAGRAMFEVKKKILEVCDLFFNYQFYLRLQRFAYDFRCLKDDTGNSGPWEHEIHINMEQSGDTVIMASPNSHEPHQMERRQLRWPIGHIVSHRHPPTELLDLRKRDWKAEKDEWLMNVARERLKHIFEQTAFFGDKDPDPRKHEFVKTLLEIADYEDNDLLVLALHLLNRYFSMESDLFTKAAESQLLELPESVDTQKEVEKKVARFRQICLHDLDKDHMTDLSRILEEMTRLCILDSYLEEPHPQNQRILYNHGVLSDVLNLIFDHLDSRVEAFQKDKSAVATGGVPVAEEAGVQECGEDFRCLEMLFAGCFKFLVALARGNHVVKEHLFNRMDSLLSLGLAVPEMAKLLYEVFSNFKDLCLRVEESQIEKVFSIIPRVNGTAQAELLQMLRALTSTKVDEIYLPIQRNQAFIIKWYSKSRGVFESVLGQKEDTKKKRLELLTASQDCDDLLLLVNTTDVLASCCEGATPSVQSVCQTIFSVEELLEYLCNDDITPERKRPFCRFLVWVYLSTNSEAAVQLNLYSTNEKMHSYLGQCIAMMQELENYLRAVPADKFAAVRRQLRRCRSYAADMKSWPRPRTFSSPPSKQSDAVAAVTSTPEELAKEMLPYFMHGILPLLKVFYQQFLVVPHTSDDTILKLIAEAAQVLMGLVGVIDCFLSNSDQAVLLRDCILQLTSSQIIDEYLKVPVGVQLSRCEDFIQKESIKTKAMEEYEGRYHTEVKLNEEFNAYVHGYEHAYNGPNKIRHQLALGLRRGEFLDEPYTEFDEEKNERGDEYLPLGPSFQAFVSCFTSEGGKVEVTKARHLIRLLDVSLNHVKVRTEAERLRQDLLDAKCLQVLRAMIHNQIKQIDPELKENEPEKYRRLAESIKQMQDEIQKLGSNPVASIVPVLAHHNDTTAAEALAFLSVFLYDGNVVVQNGFGFLANTREERFFVNIRKRLHNYMALDTERRSLEFNLLLKRADNEKLKLESTYRGRKAGKMSHRMSQGRAVGGAPIAAAAKQIPAYTRPAVTHKMNEGNAYEMTTFGEEEEPGSTAYGTFTNSLLRDATIRHSTRIKHTFAATKPPAAEGAEKGKLQFQDSNYVELALRVLGLMCDGQNWDLQNYLREQPENFNNVNLVAEVAHFLLHFYSDVNEGNIELVNRIMQTLVELCVGNYSNQLTIFDCHIVHIINHILQTTAFSECKTEDVMQLKASAVELLEVMLEETHKNTPELAKNVGAALSVPVMHSTLVYFHGLRDDLDLKKAKKDDDAERAMFRVFHVLRHLGDFDGISKEKFEDTKEKPSEAWTYCMGRSRSVEVLYKDREGGKVLSRLHFRYQPDDELPEEIIDKVKWSVSRDSAESKVRDYLEWMKAVKKEVTHVKRLREFWFTRIFIYKASYQHWALVLLTLLLNVLVLISWRGAEELETGNFETRTVQLNSVNNVTSLTEQTAQRLPTIPLVEVWFGFFALFILGAVHLVMTIIQVIAYFLVNWPNFYIHVPQFVCYLRYLFVCKRKQKEPSSSDGTFLGLRTLHGDPSCSDVPLFGLRTLYYLVFLSCSILSLCFWGYFYSICLLHIVVNNDLLQRVLRSVTKNGKSLLWVAALISVVIYIYAVVAYAGYQIYFDDSANGSHCKTLFECVVSVFRLGLLNGALATNENGIFRESNTELLDDFGLYIPRTLFDLTFFIIVTTIGLNIVFGIIVDTFSELRDERYKTMEDQTGYCFICHNEAHEFERHAEGFDHHTKHEHNMWDYIYLCLELDRIDSSNRNAIQKYVFEQIEANNTAFFPTLRARCLKKEDDTTKEDIADLKDMMQVLLDTFKMKKTSEPNQDEADHTANRPTSRPNQDEADHTANRPTSSLFGDEEVVVHFPAADHVTM